MESKNSIGRSLGSTLTSIKTKGGEVLGATARFLRWSINPVKNFFSYLVGRSQKDDAQGASLSSKESDVHLSSRHVTVSNGSTKTIAKKTANDAASTSNNEVLLENKYQKSKQFIVSAATEMLRTEEEWKIAHEAAGFLNKELSGLLSRLPKVSLEDSRGVLEAYYRLTLLSPESLPKRHDVHKAIRKFEEHFQNTRQSDGFTDLKIAVGLSSLHHIRAVLGTQDFQKLLKRCKPNSELRKVWRNVLKPIVDNVTSLKQSIHGHPREVVSAKDYHLIWECKDCLGDEFHHRVLKVSTQLTYAVKDVHRKMRQLPDKLRNLNIENVDMDFKLYERLQSNWTPEQKEKSQDFKELEARCKGYRDLIAEGRAALLDLQLNQGRRWDLNLLSQKMRYGLLDIYDFNRNDQMFKNLLELDRLKGPQVDLGQLDWIIAQNNKAKIHPNVAIEGGGPTGLTLAFTQFQEGANVSVFEKRSTQYNRVPVVRLDPKWMDMLKFYLGEHFYDMFGQDGEPGKGVIRPDGFGEIVMHRLEEGLNHRLTELMARNYEHTSQSHDSRKAKIERLAAYEMTDVESGENGFTVQAKYNPKYDPSPFANREKPVPVGYQPPEALVSRPVDLVICAGGKNSQLRNKYMEDQIVTDAQSYGVCSWEGPKDQPIANARLNTFPDFRGVVVLDKEFQQFFREQMKFQLDQIKGLSADERQALSQLSDENSRFVRELALSLESSSTRQIALQTRCFENKNLVYIGMEIPEEFIQFRQDVKNEFATLPVPEFDQNGVKRSADDQQEWRHKRADSLQKALSKAWFQTVAHSYGIDQSMGITEEKINGPFAGTFSVQQHRVKKNVIEQRSGSHNVVITAAGDAAASPHFMRYSGLTGARENALHLQKYTRELSNRQSPNSRQDDRTRRVALKTLEEKQQRTGDFVIQRGEAFLGKPSRLRRWLGVYRASKE